MGSYHEPDVTDLTRCLAEAAEAAPTLLGTTLLDVRRRARRCRQLRAWAASLVGGN